MLACSQNKRGDVTLYHFQVVGGLRAQRWQGSLQAQGMSFIGA